MANLSFVTDFRKKLGKIESISTEFGPPVYWDQTGNLALNKIMSGSWNLGIPQGRITCLAGPSGSGKSFVACNIMMNAQKNGSIVLVIDSENALDENFMRNVGVDVSEDKLIYAGVTTFNEVTEVLSEFISGYEKEFGRDNPNAQKVMIVLDSIDMLLTNSEIENFDKKVMKGDQGQRAKQSKHLLKTLVNRISRLNITFIMTHQVYQNMDVLNGEGVWIVNNAIKYAASQIMLITKLKLKEETEVIGIKMRVETYKSRFAKLGSKIEIEVPYSRGMNPFSGFMELIEKDGTVVKKGGWYSLELPGEEPIKFQKSNLTGDLIKKILSHPKYITEEKLVSQAPTEIDIPEVDHSTLDQLQVVEEELQKEELED